MLVLDEPLNGLDPMARAESLALFQGLAGEGLHVVISSHILHEVDRISDQVVLLSHGYVVAEGQIHGVRSEVHRAPAADPGALPRGPHLLAAGLFARRARGRGQAPCRRPGPAGAHARRRPPSTACSTGSCCEDGVELEAVAPADDDVGAVYQYLIGSDTEAV